MDKKNPIYTDAVGKPQQKPSNPSELSSPIELLNPDRYEFYTFDDNGDLVKRLMSLEEIKSIIATGDSDVLDLGSFSSQGFLPEKRVSDIVSNVQNVVKDEMEILKDPISKPIFDTPDVSDTWSMILPAVFGNSGQDIKPEKPTSFVTPDTIMLEPSSSSAATLGPQKLDAIISSIATTKKTTPQVAVTTSSTPLPVYYSSSSLPTTFLTTKKITTTSTKPTMKVEIISNGLAPTRPPLKISSTTSSDLLRTTSSSLGTDSKKQTVNKITPNVTTAPNIIITTVNKISPIINQRPNSSTHKPNIFGFSNDAITKPSIKVASKPTRPPANIFGFPLGDFKNNNPTSTLITSTAKIPSVSTSTTIKYLTSSTTTEATKATTVTTTASTTTTLASSTPEIVISTTEEIPSTTSEPSISTIKDALNFESTKIQSSQSSDLSALHSEIFPSTAVAEYTTKLPPLLNSLNENQKISASELLDQLLLTSTNLYDINTELSSGNKLNNNNNTQQTTESDNILTDNNEQQTTVEQDIITYIPPSTTTDITLIQSIEQLLSQAVGDVQQVLNLTTEIVPQSTNYFELSKQENLDLTSTTTDDEAASFSTTLEPDSLNNSAAESLLDQVTDDKIAGFTKIPLNSNNTPSSSEIESTTYTDNKSTDGITEQESTTYYYVIRTKPTNKQENITTTEPPRLINITILSSEGNNVKKPKPAKSDLSLEQDFINEEKKLIKNDVLVGSDTKTVEINSTDDSAQFITTENYETSTIMVETTPVPVVKKFDISTTAASTTSAITKRTPPRPSIVITINENSTVVTENKKVIANKTYSSPAEEKNKLQHNQTWTLVSTLVPQLAANFLPSSTPSIPVNIESSIPIDLVPRPMQGFGLEESTSALDVDVHQFVQLCNELAFGFWKTVTTGLSQARSIFVSPFAATSMLAMVFLGAKGATSEEMNEILKLDDMVTFNPHLTFKSVSESIVSKPNNGVANAAIIRELFSDRSKGKLLDFYKNRVRAFYDGYAEEVSYREIGDVIKRKSNALVEKYTKGKYSQFLNDSSIISKPPLCGISINIFETDCSQFTSTDGSDGEMPFVTYPTLKEKRFVSIPAVVYKSNFLAGYEPSVDATAIALGTKDQTISTIFVIPGRQGISSPGDGLGRLEKRLLESSFKKGAWSRLLRTLIPRPGLEVQIPRFSHRSIINATNTLQRMGLHELFNPETADLRGLNGVSNELHLSEIFQINKFEICGEKGRTGHHSEIYPATTMRGRSARRLSFMYLAAEEKEPRDYQRSFHDPRHDPSLLELPLPLRPRQARIPEIPKLRFDRPFLYFIRHNPTGLILHMGRFNPRLLP